MSHPQPQTYPIFRVPRLGVRQPTRRARHLLMAVVITGTLFALLLLTPRLWADELAPDAPGSINGIVRNPQGEPMAGIMVNLYQLSPYQTGNWSALRTATTDASGRYHFTLLSVGVYRVGAYDPQGSYAPTYYPAAPGLYQSTDILVAGNQITNVDLTMQPGGQIMGTITGADGMTITRGTVTLIQRNPRIGNDWQVVQMTQPVESSGFYSFTMLSANAYRICVTADSGSYPFYECYDNVYEVNRATDIVVTAGVTTSNINITLGDNADYAQISGRVVGPANEPLADITVVALVMPPPSASAAAATSPSIPTATPVAPSLSPDPLIPPYFYYPPYFDYPSYSEYPYYGTYSTRTDSQGLYHLPTMSAGRYTLYFLDPTNQYAFEYYNQTQVQTEATILELAPKQKLTDITIQLDRSSAITGTVTLLGQPASNTLIRVERKTPFGWQLITSTQINDPPGLYEINGLAAGIYRVAAEGVIPDNYGYYYYQGYFGGSTPESAGEITLVAGEQKRADIVLTGGEQFEGTVSGRITAGGAPLAGAKVILYRSLYCCDPSFLNQLTYVLTDGEGRYSVTGLSPSQLRIRASDPAGVYATTYYTAAIVPSNANLVTVDSGKTVTGIDIDLPPGGSISGRAVRRNGEPVAGLEVTLYAPRLRGGDYGSIPVLSTDNRQTDADGRYIIKGLYPGDYYVCLRDLRSWHSECYGMENSDINTLIREHALVTVVAGATTTADLLWGPDFTYYLPLVPK